MTPDQFRSLPIGTELTLRGIVARRTRDDGAIYLKTGLCEGRGVLVYPCHAAGIEAGRGMDAPLAKGDQGQTNRWAFKFEIERIEGETLFLKSIAPDEAVRRSIGSKICHESDFIRTRIGVPFNPEAHGPALMEGDRGDVNARDISGFDYEIVSLVKDTHLVVKSSCVEPTLIRRSAFRRTYIAPRVEP